MFTAFNTSRHATYFIIQARNKSSTHWAKLRKKTGPKYKALHHFDEFYGSVFANKWNSMKEALLRRSKYVAVINNYGDADKTEEYLSNRGAHCLKHLITVQQKFHNTFTTLKEQTRNTQTYDRLEAFASLTQNEDISKVYSSSSHLPDRLDAPDITLHSGEQQEILKDSQSENHITLDQTAADAEIDESRIINPSLGMTAESLYQYVPATKLKGMDEWLPESLYYTYYSKGKDFPLVIEPENELCYPEHLKVYTYEMHSEQTEFPEPRRCQTGVFNYYPMDCGSVLTVLALGINPGDRVLDLCGAPGGKTLVALQTLLPDIIVCNDISISRSNRTERILCDYLYDYKTSNKWRERVVLTRVDGRKFIDDQGFDKVLVDVPCTTDRHSVKEDDNNIFRPDRIKERLKIPELQASLLSSALTLVKVGGSVVYSTCSLSPIQNDGVVHLALKNVFESHGIIAHVKDLTQSLIGWTSTLRLGSGAAQPKYGQLVTPAVEANFGPTYFSKLVRIK